MSPVCVQYETCEGAAQVPPLHLPLQHSASPPQLLPAVLHEPLSALHEPDTHCVLQQPPAVHGCPLEMHWVTLQVPLVQSRLQQSVACVHAVAPGRHADSPQTCMVGSQVPEQQSPPTAQVAPPMAQPPGPPSIMSSVPSGAAMSAPTVMFV